MSRLTERLQRRLGYTVTRWPLPNTLPHHLKNLVRAQGVDAVIDVGGHHGEFARRLRTEVKFRGPIATLEPAPDAYELLSGASAGDPSWSVHGFALGAEEASATLTVFESTSFSSFHEPSEFGSEKYGMRAAAAVDVPVRRLDHVWRELVGDARSVLVKSDTQGHDLDVVVGMGDRRPSVVLLEVSMIPIYQGTPSATEVMAAMAERGYGLTGMFPVSRAGQCVIEFDATFVPVDS